MQVIRIEVLGTPRPGGSKAPGMDGEGNMFVRDANPNTAIWRAEVSTAAAKQYNGELLSGPVEMIYDFRFQRPGNHYGTGKNAGKLKPNAPVWHTNVPDLTKVIRSTEDALTGIVWTDDKLVCKRYEIKRYANPGERPGVTLLIAEIQ